MAKKASKPKTKKPRAKKPRSQPLPGMEDARIRELDDIAASYAEIRDQRIALNKDEAELKASAIALMRKHGKTIYRHDGIEIRIIPGEEDVKVKVKPPKEEEDAPNGVEIDK